MSYKHILVAIDLSKESHILIEKAVALAQPLGAEVSFIHIDVNYAEIYTGLIDINLSETQNHAMEESLAQLKLLAEQAKMPIKHTLVGSGDLGYELKETIDKKDVDLVICGHHQDFWSVILSSTKQLLNSVPVDMLVVPLHDD
ncbi:universal stress protein [Vibrio sp. DW001]|uniref:universal stress protein n=1 Tax=unclassified Vibrio TaxID=2614977 RepID=UPI00189E4698|nr:MULTISPECIES: universal stress protein [unclassified Vibrio]UGA54855.1 universal stress protein [Vibrio sp. VB16]WED26741.1 universal stress protein [Vibrio sp. DW001]